MKKVLGTFLPLNSLQSLEFGDQYFENAKLFLNWLKETGQNTWQILPLYPTDIHKSELLRSPYSSFGIGINQSLAPREKKDEYDLEKFKVENADWIYDFGLFVSLSRKYGEDWRAWPLEYKELDGEALENYANDSKEDVNSILSEQCYLISKFREIKNLANSMQIEIWGDLPFYISVNSPLVWEFQDVFCLNSQFVSGVFKGRHFERQFWNHPLYDFEDEAKLSRILDLWKIRMKFASKMFDRIRLDHATGFYRYAKMSQISEEDDYFAVGQGDKIFVPLVNYAKEVGVNLIVESTSSHDSGKFLETIQKEHIPGIQVFTQSLPMGQTFFDKRFFDIDRIDQGDIYYTSSHDNPTLLGFMKSLSSEQKRTVADLVGSLDFVDPRTLAIKVRSLLLRKAENRMIPLQDWLLTEERINYPATISDLNWNYKMSVPIEELPDSVEA